MAPRQLRLTILLGCNAGTMRLSATYVISGLDLASSILLVNYRGRGSIALLLNILALNIHSFRNM